MRNLTFTERVLVVGAMLTLLIGAGLRYHRTHAAAAESLAQSPARDAEG